MKQFFSRVLGRFFETGHDDTLRANQFPESAPFSPYAALLATPFRDIKR